MQAIRNSYLCLIKQMWNDWILCASLFVPIFCGIVFVLGIPALEKWLCDYFRCEYILQPYYPMFQLVLLLLPALIMAFISVMVVLDEIDNGIAKYLCVTPLNRQGYLLTRFGINCIAIIPYTIIVNILFSLHSFPIIEILIISILFSVVGYIVAFAIATLSKNRVEGMAFVKLISMVFLLGLPIPYILVNNWQYVFAALPTFWIARFSKFLSVKDFLITLICCLLWYWILRRKFIKRIL